MNKLKRIFESITVGRGTRLLTMDSKSSFNIYAVLKYLAEACISTPSTDRTLTSNCS